ncbi:MAG: hypothetical protein QHD01_16860 [Bradyrhizobium sp.]|uniref:hypothetical protein n=1 Tax=Bradyrhizobium sp. TaxID=376 RepID=UPI0029AD2082|nr:hypothetical protein [Bradyrhizobium sp.]MDX3968256.1 hypothetical protein [Bradyrhizobium sp.]
MDDLTKIDEAPEREQFDLADLLEGVELDGDAAALEDALKDELLLQRTRREVEALARQSAKAGLKNLRKQSIGRRKSGKRTLGPFLTVRKHNAAENRGAMIVIQDGRQQVTTKIPAIPGLLEEDHEGALAELEKHVRKSAQRERVAKDPDSIPLDRLFERFLQTKKPGKGCAGYATLMKTYDREDAANWWLVKFAKGKTLGYVDDDFGKEYKRWRLEQKARVDRKDERRDSAIEKEQYHARQAFRWISKKLRKEGIRVPDLSFEIQKAPKKQKKSLTWTEVEWLLLACLGFQRDGKSYKKKLEVRHGVEREVWDRLDSSQTKWLIRFFLVYLCTGTRFSRNRSLLWGVNDGVGSLDPDGRAIWRNGRQEELNNRKIAGRSPLTPLFKAIVKKWFAQDTALSRKWGFEPIYVIHDGDGNPLPNVDKLVLEVFRRAGLDQSAHILKHTFVTLHGLAGATSDEISEASNTDKDTIEDTYTWVEWFENKLERRGGKAEITRLIELKKASPPPIPPEIAAMAIAKLNRTASAECRI